MLTCTQIFSHAHVLLLQGAGAWPPTASPHSVFFESTSPLTYFERKPHVGMSAPFPFFD